MTRFLFVPALLALPLLAGCATLRPLAAAALDCAAPAIASSAASLMGAAAGALRGDPWDGGAALDGLLRSAGPAFVCAVSKIAATAAAMPQAEGELRPAVTSGRAQLGERARAWLASRGHQVPL